MALTRYQLADKLRTMKQGGSKAPMQNVKLPTNQSSYRTPTATTTTSSAQQGQQGGMDPMAAMKAGQAVGRMAKAWNDGRNASFYDFDKASNAVGQGQQLSSNTAQLGGMLGALQGNNVDVAAKMAEQTAGNMANLPTGQVSMFGNGVPVTPGEWMGSANAGAELGLANGGNIGSQAIGAGADAAAGAADAAGAASNLSQYALPGVGTALGLGVDLANKDYGAAAGRAIGAGLGSFMGPMGTLGGGMIGGMLGKLF